MSILTRAQADVRYLKLLDGGTLNGLIFVPTASTDDQISPLSAVVNKQFVRDNLVSVAGADARYAQLSGATFAGPVLLPTAPPSAPRHAVSLGFLESRLAQVQPSTQLADLQATGGSAFAWTPTPAVLGRMTLAADSTLSVAAGQDLQPGATYRLMVVQPQTGGPRTLVFSPQFAFPGGLAPTLTSRPGGIDLFQFVSDGQRLFATGLTDYLPL